MIRRKIRETSGTFPKVPVTRGLGRGGIFFARPIPVGDVTRRTAKYAKNAKKDYFPTRRGESAALNHVSLHRPEWRMNDEAGLYSPLVLDDPGVLTGGGDQSGRTTLTLRQ
jgi:hypothetical protein